MSRVDDSLSETFMAHRSALARFLAIRCGGDVAEDLLQELWIKVQLRDAVIEKPLPYLYRMAHRLVLDTRRGASRAKDREHSWSITSGAIEDAEAALAERALLARERLQHIEAALGRLGARAARIFLRYRVDGVEQRRIAEELGVSLSTVEKELRRSYVALSGLEREPDEG